MTSLHEQQVVRAATRACRAKNLKDSPLLVSAVLQKASSEMSWRQAGLEPFASVNDLSFGAAVRVADEVLESTRRDGRQTAMIRVVAVTALPLEAAALEAYLEDVKERVHPDTGTVYRVGTLRHDDQEIAVAVVVAMEGNPAAATETERAIAHFKPDVAVFVGVAGGLKEDVRKGDIVVASSVYDYSSAKEVGGLVRSRIKTLPASYKATQRALALAASGDWKRLAAKGVPALLSGDDPRVLVKPIAAGPKLVADSDGPTAKWISQYCGDAVAVEMEGFGFHTALHAHPTTQAVVVRGISDCVDDKAADGDEHWQPIAASRASAFALAVCSHLVSKF